MLFISPKKYFIFSRYLDFCLDFLVQHKNCLIKKILILKFMTPQPGKQSTIHILPNISRSKGNQTMKFGRLIKYYMKNFFLKKHTQNILEKPFPDLFLKNWNWAYFWIISLKFYTVCFYCMPSWVLLKYIETNVQTSWSY